MSDRAVALRLIVSCWLVYLLFLDPYPMSMAKDLLGLGVSFGEGSVTIRTHDVGEGELALRDGQRYSGLPPGGSAVVTPVYLLFRPWLPSESRALLFALNILCIVLVSAPFAALTPAILYVMLGDLDVPKRIRLETALLVAFATTHFGYATGYFKENMTIALTVLGFALLVRARRMVGYRAWLGVLAGTALGIAVTTVYTSVAVLGVLGLYAWLAIGWGAALLFFAGAVPWGLLLMWYHAVAYGSPFATAYTYHVGLPAHAPWFGTLDLERWLGMVLSPGSGLFVFAPVTALGVVGLVRALRSSDSRRAEAACCLGVFLVIWVLYGHYRVPAEFFIPLPHDMGLVTRYLSVTVPFLMIGYALVCDQVPATLRRVACLLTLVLGYLSAVPGLNPTFEAPILYALKVTISTFGMGMLFGQCLPEVLGVATFHTVLRRPEVGAAQLLSGSPGVLAQLVLTQFVFVALFLGAAAVVALIVARLWRAELGSAGVRTAIPAARAALRWP